MMMIIIIIIVIMAFAHRPHRPLIGPIKVLTTAGGLKHFAQAVSKNLE